MFSTSGCGLKKLQIVRREKSILLQKKNSNEETVIRWMPGLFARGYNDRDVQLTNHLHLVPL